MELSTVINKNIKAYVKENQWNNYFFKKLRHTAVKMQRKVLNVDFWFDPISKIHLHNLKLILVSVECIVKSNFTV